MSDNQVLTEEDFQRSLPSTLKRGVPTKVMQDINDMIVQGVEGEVFKENLLTHADILKEGKFSIEQYVNAAKYVSFRLLKHTQRKAYEKTFPDKVTDWMARNVDTKTISTYVNAYNNSKLVMRLYEVSLVPFHLLNQPLRQEALLKEAKLMRGYTDSGKEVTPMVQHLAAAKILDILTPPETTQTELALKHRDSEETSELKKAMADLARAQKEALEKGGNLKDIAESTIVEGEYTEEDDR